MYWNSERCRQMALPIRTVPLHMARLNPSCVLRPFLVIINQCWCISLLSIQPITDSKHSSIFLSDFQLHVTIIVCNFFLSNNKCLQTVTAVTITWQLLEVYLFWLFSHARGNFDGWAGKNVLQTKLKCPPDWGRASRTANGWHPQPYQLLVHASIDDLQPLFASLVSSSAAST